MSIVFNQLRERLINRFPSTEDVEKSVLRFTRNTLVEDSSYAVCYLDLSDELPTTRDSLLAYQDRVIGQRYFQGPKSLQWNTYLYFVTKPEFLASPEGQSTKELIEGDRTYARKLVFAIDDVENIFDPLGPKSVKIAPAGDILSVWTNKLIKAGLYESVFGFGDNQMPARLKYIESATLKTINNLLTPKSALQGEKAQFLSKLRLEKYRQYPSKRDFDFGTVNLIVGANGSGKTSLLEAIELFYCGSHNREESKPPAYELIATWANGNSESANHQRSLQEFRNRNLAWYGQHELKTNNLYQSFGRFNFLNTDAAVSLSTSSSRLSIEEDLSKLLVGAEASRTWRIIQDLSYAISNRVRELQVDEKRIDLQLSEIEEQLVTTAAIPQASNALYNQVEKISKRLGWPSKEEAIGSDIGDVTAELTEFSALIKKAISFKWLESPISIGVLTDFLSKAQSDIDQADNIVTEWRQLTLVDKVNLIRLIEQSQNALTYAQKAFRNLNAGVKQHSLELNEQQAIAATYAEWLNGYEPVYFDLLKQVQPNSSVSDSYEQANTELITAQRILVHNREEHERFSSLRDQSLKLAQQLRQFATKILEDSSVPDTCPLCHTSFAPGELALHIATGVDEPLEVVGQNLLQVIHENAIAVQTALNYKTALAWLVDFCNKSETRANTSISDVLFHVATSQQKLVEAENAVGQIKKEISSSLAQGYSEAELKKAVSQLNTLNYSIELSPVAAETLTQNIELDIKYLNDELKKNLQIEQELNTRLATYLGQALSLNDYTDRLSQKKEQYTAVSSLNSKLSSFLEYFPWPITKPLSSLLLEVELLGKMVAEWRTALDQEKQTRLANDKSTKLQASVLEQHRSLKPRLNRFIDAQEVFSDLVSKHSLTSAMETALHENRVGIEEIFARIHSPNEFTGFGKAQDTITLVRKESKKEASLNQISTGQRAAFALSVFLAQNARLNEAAPRALLIDDPIAHIDDLNSLTFIDYLREIVLASKRQLFFATSDDKLAALIERKFDFMGKQGFRRFDLSRAEPLLA